VFAEIMHLRDFGQFFSHPHWAANSSVAWTQHQIYGIGYPTACTKIMNCVVERYFVNSVKKNAITCNKIVAQNRCMQMYHKFSKKNRTGAEIEQIVS
jgi:hypothetical protein